MTKIEKSVVVNASPEKVWGYMTEPKSPLEWVKDIVVYEREGLALGSKTYIESRVAGVTFRWTTEISELEENKKYTHRLVEGDFKEFKQSFTAESVPEGTRVTMTLEYEPPYSILGKILDKLLIEREASSIWDESMDRIKENVEK